jgi:hypothetical protein
MPIRKFEAAILSGGLKFQWARIEPLVAELRFKTLVVSGTLGGTGP